jgi:hypothetical protein
LRHPEWPSRRRALNSVIKNVSGVVANPPERAKHRKERHTQPAKRKLASGKRASQVIHFTSLRY